MQNRFDVCLNILETVTVQGTMFELLLVLFTSLLATHFHHVCAVVEIRYIYVNY
jgi:hypothetical protein